MTLDWYEIPFVIDEGTYDLTGSLQLSGVTYLYRVLWNTRTARWAFSLATMTGTPLIVDRPLCLLVDVLGRCNASGRPPGNIFPMREDLTFSDFGHLDLGASVKLWYRVAS
jgi:hypothetical protein